MLDLAIKMTVLSYHFVVLNLVIAALIQPHNLGAKIIRPILLGAGFDV